MGLSFSLLAIVEKIMEWIVVFETGGFMNSLFDVTYNITGAGPSYDLKPSYKDPDFNFAMDMLLMTPRGFPILESLPREFGGGKANANRAIENPNREGLLFWITIGSFLTCMLLIITIQALTCRRSLKKKKVSI